eukprot:gene9259-14345_t
MAVLADTRENMKDDAEARRSLVGNNVFENLGEPIKRIILQVEQENGKEVDEATLQLLQHITVKQLAKIFDMLGQGEDPETILAWLKRRARKNKGNDDGWKEERKALIKTGAERDPIAFFKAIEQANADRTAELEAQAEEREQLRLARAKERDAARAELTKQLDDAKKAMADEGGFWKATDVMPEKDKNAINNAFEKFASKNSGFDNSDKDQDGEWWKRDPFRRDWERHKGKGKKWTGVVEGAKERATDGELAVREEFYRGNDWWKADKYKRDWDATKGAEWWKEEPYIKDWQQNKVEGTRWTAADEESGLESEGDQFPASPEEQKRREDWYKANGPRGVVKKWNAATEGDPEKCSVPEKETREEFYRNGEWWKNDDARADFLEKGLDSDALTSAGAPPDNDWWKQEPYREDYWGNGDKGKKWPAITETAGIDGVADAKPAPPVEKKRRADWYKDNWWKQPKFKDDWEKKGKAWAAPSENDAKTGNGKSVGPAEKAKRDDWYKNGDDEWWQEPQYIEDYFQKGPEGRHWPAKTEEDGQGGRGQESPAADPEKKKREDWYKKNWWKQPKYVADWQNNGKTGQAWTGAEDAPSVDKEWWKQGPFIDNWAQTMKPKTQPPNEEWWKQPQYVEDFQRNGKGGKKWTGDKEPAGLAGEGDKKPAADAELSKRENWYGDNWWRAPQYAVDWAKKGPRGDRWQAPSKEVSDDPKQAAKTKAPADKLGERENFYRPVGDMWRALGEQYGFAKEAVEHPCPMAEALKRDEWYRTNWWKAPEYVEDWKKNGTGGKKWPAGCEESGKAGKADDNPCPDAERAKRDEWYRTAGDNDWWKEPQYCEDWAQNADDGGMWTADTRPNADKNGGKQHPCKPDDKDAREKWYKDNWWKTPAAFDDWQKRGKDGPIAGREKPIEVDRRDPETLGDGWWKAPEYIEDWLDNDDAGKHWTAADPAAGALGQGHKKPAVDDEKAKRAKWYKDNWWKAPSCEEEWRKKGANGDKWTGQDPEATRASEGSKRPADDPEKEKREDWYRKHGDGDEWWKRPDFVEDWKKNGPAGKKWGAGNPTAGAMNLAQECPASGPEKKKRDNWYKDNWWKTPEMMDDWKKKGDAWKKDATPEEEKKRDDWFKANAGDPASEPEKQQRDDWFKKHAKENDEPELDKREDWYRKQLTDPEKAKRMDWLKERPEKEKRILAEELPDALKAINEGQAPTDKQVKAVMDKIDWNRKAKKDDFGDKAPVDEDEPSIGQDEFLRAVADTNFYVPPGEDEAEMQAEDEKAEQEIDEMQRQEEEAAYLKMDAEDEDKKKPEAWQRKYEDPENEEWWKRPEFVEEYQNDPEAEEAKWKKTAEGDEKDADPAEVDKREKWMKDNWWKAPKFSQEWKRQDEDPDADNWKKVSRPEEDEDGQVREDDDTPHASPKVIDDREKWYRNAKNPERQFKEPDAKDDEWWKTPEYVEDYNKGGDAWAKGATPDEKDKREDWLKNNHWKTPENIENWKRAQKEPEAAPATWKRANAAPPGEEAPPESEITPEQEKDRAEWFQRVLDKFEEPEEENPAKPKPKKLDFNRQAVEPTPEQKEEEAQKPAPVTEGFSRKAAEPEKPPADVIEFVPRKAEAPETPQPVQMSFGKKAEEPFEGEKIEDYGPILEAMKRGEPEPFEGEKVEDQDPILEKLREQPPDDFVGEKVPEWDGPPFVAEKVEPQEPFVGEKVPEWEPPFEGEKLEEQEPFEGEKLEEYVNEDDLPEEVEDEPEEEAEAPPADEPMEEEDEEDDAEDQPDEEEAAWNDEDDEEEEEAEEEEEEDDGDNEHQDDEDLEAELEAALEEQEAEWEEDEDEEEEDMAEAAEEEDEEDYDEEDEEPEAPPEPYVLPLPEVTNAIYLKSYFPVLKWNPSQKYGAADRRVWVVDHFSKSFYQLDGKGKLKKTHDSNKLLQLERNITDPRRARLMFFDAPKSYEVVFPSNEERERFYETGMSIRPAIRVYAPSLTKPDSAADGGSTTTTIDGVKENAVTVKVPSPFKKTGDLVDRELSGRCKINSSKVEEEPVTIWTGTFNMCGAPPPKNASELSKWMPRGKYDLYAVGTQECSWQKEEGEWFAFVQSYLGKEYLTLASMQLWDITVIVLCRKRCLLKITNVEGSTKATLHKEKCGMKGAAGISLRFHNTSMAFVSCHLAARMERQKMRKTNVEEIVSQIQLAHKDIDLSSQFQHVFWMGDMNYRVEMEATEAEPLLAKKSYLQLLNQDQLLTEQRESGLLHGFKETPITFAPTYRFKVGSTDYMRDRGRAPSYTDRILVKSFRNAPIKCTGYNKCDAITTSEHKPVFATYVVRAVRPALSCFHRDQEPRPQFELICVEFTEQTHLLFKKPQLSVFSQFTEHDKHKGKVMKEVNSMTPSFTGEHLPTPIKANMQMTEYLERQALTFVFRDTAEPREDKMFRGAAVMELDGRIEPYDQERTELIEVLCLSRKIGVVSIKYKVTNYGYTPPPGGAAGRIPEGANMD